MTTPREVGADRIGPGDPRYPDVAFRGVNGRFRGAPDYVRLVRSTDEVARAVQDAVQEGRRIGVRSGGHCLDGLVADPAVRVVLDTSLLTGVRWDADRGAFAVEAGTTVGEVQRRLFLGWGVTLPAGESPTIGMGGHVPGGGFGFLCREHGLLADHLHAVEVVVVGEDGAARAVVATREPDDPHRDLWWAHTGGGGGAFGVATRFWFRSPGAPAEPASALPRAPASVLTFRVGWRWEDLDARAFARLVRNHGEWCEAHGGADSPFTRLFSTLFLHRRSAGLVTLRGICTAGDAAEELSEAHVGAVAAGVGAPRTAQLERLPWLGFALDPFPEIFRAPGAERARLKIKDAFLRRRLTDRQIEVLHRWLSEGDGVPGGLVGVNTYGGRVNAAAAGATASAQRDSLLTCACTAGWMEPREDERHLAWVRGVYGELFADTGGVPAPGERADGAFINHPDVDLADPRLQGSGVPWSTLYFKDGYPRLQQAKARWDPRDVFRHALSVRLP